MLISLLIPIMNRVESFKKAFPLILATANDSPPVEIVILDYGSTDGLTEYLEEIKKMPLSTDNSIAIKRLNNKFYHETHSRNYAFKISSGDYVIHLSAEALPKEDFVRYIRNQIKKHNYIWMCDGPNKFNPNWEKFNLGRYIVCQREEFEKAGGYDERFEFCSPDDKDICMRLHRRGGKYGMFPSALCDEIRTPKEIKDQNLDKSKLKNIDEMRAVMKPIYHENNAKAVLVANEGKEWGK